MKARFWETKTGYWIGIICIGIGIFGAGKFFVQGIHNIQALTDSFIRVIAPGSQEIYLPEQGVYTVFHEYQTVIDGQLFMNEDQVPGMRFSIRDRSNSRPLEVRPAGMDAHYSIGSVNARSFAEFTAPREGDYVVGFEYKDGRESPKLAFTIVKSMLKQFFLDVMLPFAGAVFTGLLLGLAGLIIIILTFLQRKKAVNPS